MASNPADLNEDGKVTKKEQKKYDSQQEKKGVRGTATGLRQDTLNRKQLRSLYGYTARQLKVDPGLFDLFQKAYKEQWDQARFDSEVEQIDWYRKNQSSIREYELLKAEGGADWEQKKLDTFEAVRQRAMKMGVNLSNERLQELADDSMRFGWGEQGREYELDKAISESESENGIYGGDIGLNQDNLRAVALANGVTMDEAWFMGKARSIAGNLSNAEDAERELRQMAADKAPAFAAEIMAGQNLDALVSPWRRMIADEWEMAPDAVGLDDPMLQSAIGGFDAQGNPMKMNLGELQIKLRKDPRWLNTNAGQNKRTSAFADVLKMFGMGN